VSTWSVPGLEGALAALAQSAAHAVWPAPPTGFTPLAPVRPMRAVFAGPLATPTGTLEVVLKTHRPVTAFDRIKLLLRGGRGPREGRLLRRLTALGLPVPEALGYDDAQVDMLVTRRLKGLKTLPAPRAASRALLERVAALLARLHRAGLVHRDLTAANLGLLGGEPLLVDLGGARLGGSPTRRRALDQLAQAAHGLLYGASRAQAARGLKAWLEAGGHGPDAWRAWIHDVEQARRSRLRRHHRRRERRIARTGGHFAGLEGPGLVGVLRVPQVPEAWRALVPAWLDAALPAAERLKGQHVLGIKSPDGRDLVLKRYAATARGRRPRALRAFRSAVTLEERGLPVARALLAAWRPGGASVLVSERLGAPDLDRILLREPVYAAWSPSRRRALLVGLGRALRAMHEAEVSHRDLKSPNLLVEEHAHGWRFPLADVDGARPRYRTISWARRLRDLGRLAASLPIARSERLRVLAAYAAVAPEPPQSLRALARGVHEVAERHRRCRRRRPPRAG
jgi:tRNA A-37 threonylcarbamoyl transferase component Bud32